MRCWGPSRRARNLAWFATVVAALALVSTIASGIPPDFTGLIIVWLFGSFAYNVANVRVCADADGIFVRSMWAHRRVAWRDVTAIEPVDRGRVCARVKTARGSTLAIQRLALAGTFPRRRFRRVGRARRDELITELERLRHAATLSQ